MRGPVLEHGFTRREVLGLVVGGASIGLVPPSRAGVGVREAEAAGLDGFVRRRMHEGRLPGLAVAIVRDGAIVRARGYGWANIPRAMRATADVEFMLASVSKTVTAVAVMQAVEERLLDLDADVGEVLPFPVRNPEFPDDPITTRMLLTHTSGISDNWDVLGSIYVAGDSPIPLGDFLADYLVPGGHHYDAERNFLSSPPGTRYRYCNEGVALAAYAVESASGTAFDARCDERIFEPLGMGETSWHLRGLDRSEVAMPYRYARARDRYRRYGQYGYPDYPDGQLRTSARALARFLLAVANRGELDGVRILAEETIDEMLREQAPDVVSGQGLVWYAVRRRGERLVGHNGGDSGVATLMFFRERDGTGVIALANGDWHRSGGRWPLSMIMDRLIEEADATG